MIKNIDRLLNSEFIDEIFDYKGLWDVPSRCGLKVVKNPKHTVVIATELYAENPGTSVTNHCAPLATYICQVFNIEPEKLIFIVHTPETRSKLSFMHEEFYKVSFTFDGEKFKNPQWEQIDKSKVYELMNAH